MMQDPHSMAISALAPDEIPELRSFLGRVFNDPDGTFLEPELLAWKYVNPRPDWDKPRSWVMRNEAHQIVAHIGLLPLRFELPSGTHRTWHGMDWASTVPKAGRVLSETVMENLSNHLRIGVGGTEKSRHVAPQMGQHTVGGVDTFAMSLRPWKQLRSSRPILRPKRVRSLLHNVRHNQSRERKQFVGWTSEQVQNFTGKSEFLGPRGNDVTRTERSPEMLNYLLTCPADCSAYVIKRHGDAMGYVLFSHRWGQTRIAELRIASDRSEDWQCAYALALDLAISDARTCEVVAAGSSEMLKHAMAANGLLRIFQRPIWLPNECPAADGIAPFELQAADSDAFFVGDPSRPFML